VFNRVKDKLTGRDFDPNVALPVEEQVDLLIKQAQDNIALSQHFTGWYVLNVIFQKIPAQDLYRCAFW
jgi:FKBP12-rapamycin complex-associated protein